MVELERQIITTQKLSIKERVANLLSIKSMITLLLTLVFAYLAVIGIIDIQNYMAIYTMIIGFYFGTQAVKE